MYFLFQHFLLEFQTLNQIGPLQDPVTRYKITYTGEQVAQWDFQNNAPAFVLEVSLRNLFTSICNFVPCDRVLQRAYYSWEHCRNAYILRCKLAFNFTVNETWTEGSIIDGHYKMCDIDRKQVTCTSECFFFGNALTSQFCISQPCHIECLQKWNC